MGRRFGSGEREGKGAEVSRAGLGAGEGRWGESSVSERVWDIMGHCAI